MNTTTLCEIPQELKDQFESRDHVKLDKLNFIVDHKHIYLSHEHSSFMSLFYVESTDFVYPKRDYKGLPITTLRFMLKELRLLKSKNNTIAERHVYFYPDTNNYITFQLVDNEVLSINLVQRKIKNPTNIIHSIFSREGKLVTKNMYIKFDEVFTSIYELSETLILGLGNREEIGGDLVVLEQQIRLSKSLFNKLMEKN
ncbi:hypothetical protein GC101_15895 [Paenibacillus sp. LMG 31459]|uniref:Uncharacterized protein n=1 Tax=Paenibacillus phytohabitans TaxID=2654978 RepID=A0ABX1YH45_9BACL|nr:hypothetical protein [Paenibacillus phytohabitans]NOU80353.1 hypothetical protein [Paenibacillus phytohabitans]